MNLFAVVLLLFICFGQVVTLVTSTEPIHSECSQNLETLEQLVTTKLCEKEITDTLVEKSINKDTHEAGFKLAVCFPFIQESTTSDKAFNKIIVDFIKQIVHEEYLPFISEDSIKERTQDGIERKYSLDISYKIFLLTTNNISVRFQVYSYTGGAHGVVWFKTITYDRLSGKELSLAELFEPGSSYLSELSLYCFHKLKKRNMQMNFSDDSWIESGTEAKEQNYAHWNFLEDGIHITFPAYSVGPWASGISEVVVPRNKLKSFKC